MSTTCIICKVRPAPLGGGTICTSCLVPGDVKFVPVEAEGVKFDGDKARMDLLPMDSLLGVGAVLGYGAKKYAPRNWEKGMAWGRLLGAAMRHLGAWALGQNNDSESGLPHLDHAACCILMLRALTSRNVGTDDRNKVVAS